MSIKEMEGNFPLAEMRVTSFQTLKAEIARRSDAQLKLSELALASFGVLAGVAAATGRNELVLIVPPLSISAGFLWLDHDQRIQHLGSYIKETLWGNREGSFEEVAERLPTPIVSFILPTVLVFVMPACVALVWGGRMDLVGFEGFIWAAEVVFVASYVVTLIYKFVRARLRRRNQAQHERPPDPSAGTI